jgi:perosamine synthetase
VFKRLIMERIPISGPWITQKEIDYVSDAAAHAWYANANSYPERFEKAFAEYIGARYAIALPSCTSAIHLSLLALGIRGGDEVLVPDITWIASAAPINYVGATPVFADIDSKTWCLSAESFESCITPTTKAAIVVDLYGNMPDMEALCSVAKRRGIALIEDAAEAVGAVFQGRRAGSFGETGVFSFHGSKTLTTGEGGMLVTNRQDIYQRCLLLRDHGRKPRDRWFFNTEVAYKYKMSSLQAALGLAQLERLEELINRKRQIFDWYARELDGLEDAALNYEAPGTRNVYWMVTVVLGPAWGIKKDLLMEKLDAKQIDTRPFFHPLSSLPAYEGLEAARVARQRNLVSYFISPYAVNLPSALNLTEDNVKYVCGTLKALLLEKRQQTSAAWRGDGTVKPTVRDCGGPQTQRADRAIVGSETRERPPSDSEPGSKLLLGRELLVHHCSLCGSRRLRTILERRGVPVHQNLIYRELSGARGCLRGDLTLALCEKCGFVFNRAFEPGRLRYCPEYDSNQDHSALFRKYMESLASYLIEKYELVNKTIVEIGCGKGSFLKLLCQGGRNQGFGFDPTYAGPEAIESGKVRFERTFYGGRHALPRADLIVCRQVLETVADPLSMLRALKTAGSGDSRTHVFFEVPDLVWTLKECSVWDLYYEHCSYFTKDALSLAVSSCGFQVLDVRRAFGDQYLWLEAVISDSSPEGKGQPGDVETLTCAVKAFQARLELRLSECAEKMRRFHGSGGCAVWGAAAKGATFLNLLDPDCRFVRCAVDINPAKQDCYVAGTGHPVVSPERLREFPLGGILVMNPGYLYEIKRTIRELGVRVDLDSL